MEKSPLRRLSPEVRNMIYEYTFAGSEVNLCKIGEGVGAVTQLCKEIRSEARLLLFHTADFRLGRDVWKWVYPTGGPARIGEISNKFIEVFGADAAHGIQEQVVKVDNVTPPTVQISCRALRYDCPKCNAAIIPTGEQAPETIECESDEGVWYHGIYDAFCSERRRPRGPEGRS